MRAERFLLPKTFAEFFAGIALMRMGLECAGWIPAFANDIDPDKEEMYRTHFNDEVPHFFCVTCTNWTPGWCLT